MVENRADAATDPFTEWRLLAVASALRHVSQREFSSVAADLVADGLPGEALLALAASYVDIDSESLRQLVSEARRETGIVEPSEGEAYAFELRETIKRGVKTEALLDFAARQMRGLYYFWDDEEPSDIVRAARDLTLGLDHLLDEWRGADSDPRRRELMRNELSQFLAECPDSRGEHLGDITSAPVPSESSQ